MSMKQFVITLAVCGAAAGFAVAEPPVDRAGFRVEADTLRHQFSVTATDKDKKVKPGGADTDSFGRNVIFDGLMSSGTVSLQPDCTPVPGDPAPGPDDRCAVLNAAPAVTTFNFPDIGRLTIPGESAHSLLCHWLTPIAYYQFDNTTGAPANATIRLIPYVVIDSDALKDPSLIDPTTGLPFNGHLTTSFAATYQDSQTTDPGHTATRRFSETRVCIGGFLSKQGLKDGWGLTDEQAKRVFEHDITLHFGVRGNAALLSGGFVLYGLRVVGD